jgi:hypothetical protein
MKGAVVMLRAWLYRVITRFIRENMGVEVTVEDNGNPNYRTLYVHLKIGNEVVASDYTKLEVQI